MDRKLYDYLPMFLHTVQELMALMNAQQPEADALWQATDDVMNERYVDSSTEYGVKRWESILQITPKAIETMTERKNRIKQRIGLILPYTLPWLRTSLASQYGADNFSAYLEKYVLYLAVNPSDEDSTRTLDALLESLQEIKPTNVILRAAFRFVHGIALGKVFSHYMTEAPLCGTLFCGTFPDISSIGESFINALAVDAELSGYPSDAAFCDEHLSGVYPETAAIGEAFTHAATIAAKLNNYPATAAFCGAAYCGE